MKQATQYARENPDDPEAILRLSKARLDAQERAGVPDGARSAITKTEARVLAAPLRGIEGKDLRQKSPTWLEGLQQKYGDYARSVARDAIRMAITQDKDTADVATSQLEKVLSGQNPSAASVRRLEFLNEINMASQAFGGTPHSFSATDR